MTIEDIKNNIDIIQLANQYGFELKTTQKSNRYRAKNNLLREEKTSSIDFFSDTQKYWDRGSGNGGDVIDLIMAMDNCDIKVARAKAKEMAGGSDYKVDRKEYVPVKKEVKEVDFNNLFKSARGDLENVVKFSLIEKDGFIYVPAEFKKLFEIDKFKLKYEKQMRYIFSSILGFSNYWKAPSIILHDRDDRVVDVVAYRPKDIDSGIEIKGMKYFYRNFLNRGNRFRYPFEKYMIMIASREKYIVVGEGLKNALNALVYGVAFISVEASTNKISDDLLKAVDEFTKKGYGVICGFDGDSAGKTAFNNFTKASSLNIDNLFKFDSNIDFTEYVIKGGGVSSGYRNKYREYKK